MHIEHNQHWFVHTGVRRAGEAYFPWHGLDDPGAILCSRALVPAGTAAVQSTL